MFVRRCVAGLLAFGLVGVLAGCGNPQGLDSVSVSPSTQSLTVGQTAQFSATGTYGNSGHASTQNITDGVSWSSSTPSVATVSSTGMATAVGAGTATITASAAGFAGPVASSATLTVAATGGSGTASGSIASILVIPSTQAVALPGQTSQFLAIGTTSSGATVNITNQVAWSISTNSIATIGAGTGLATAVGQGSATITALYQNTGGTVVTGTATFSVSSGSTEKYTSVTILPGSTSLSASGQTGQFVALATTGGSSLQTDVTSSAQIKWSSNIPTVASISATGLVTGLSAGNTTITAELTNPDGTVVSNTAAVAVSLTAAPEPLLSLTIIPSDISVGNLQDTGQFLAIGTYSVAPYVRDLTNSPNLNWISSFPNVFPVDTNSGGNSGASAGLVTAFGNGTADIIAEVTNPADGTIQTATATFDCPLVLQNLTGNPPTPGSCYPGSQAYSLLATLTIYNEGLNTTSWQVTAPSATGTAHVIHCGPGWTGGGGSVCTAPYPLTTNGITATSVVLEAQGGNFGGWSYNCTSSDANGNTTNPPPVTAAGPNYCVVSFGIVNGSPNSNVTVGAIFN